MKLLNKIVNFGVSDKISPLLKRKIKLTNQISLAISLVFVLIVILMTINKHFSSAVVMFILSFIYFFIPFLNKKHHNLSSLIVSILIPIFIILASVVAKVKDESTRDIAFYITPRLMIFASLVISLVLIDYKKKFTFYFSIFVYFVAFVLFDLIHQLAGVGIRHAIFGAYSEINIALASLFSLIVLIFSFIFMQRLNHNYEEELEISNSSFKEKNDELIATEEELRQSNEELLIVKEVLEEKEERLRYILENQGDGFGIINLNGIFTVVNPAAEYIFGVEKDQLVGKNISDFIQDKEFINLLKIIKENKKITKNDFEIQIDTQKNEKKYILVTVNIDKDRNENIIGLNGVFKDITAQKKEQEKTNLLNIELKKYFIALHNTPATIVITDLEGNIEYVNPFFTKMTGYTFDEAIGKNPRILKTKYTPAETFTDLWKTISSGKVWEGELINHKKDGDIFYEKAVIAPVKNNSDELISYIAIKEDITEFKKAQEKLAETISQQEILINNLPARIFLKNSELKYLTVNKKYANSLNLSVEDMKGKKFTDLIKNKEFVEETDMKIIETKQGLYDFETQEDDKWLSISKVPYFDEKGNVDGIIGIIQDITGRKLKEQKIVELNKELKKYFVTIEQSTVGIAFINKKGIRQYVNSKYLEITGYTEEQAVGQKSTFFDENNFKDLEKLKRGETIRKEYRRKAVNEYYQRIVVSPLLNDNKEIELYIFLIEDITNEKRQQRIIQDQYEKLQSALENINESLNYAKLIQQSLLPDEQIVNKYFPDNFILFSAKDVVSGDFYFFKKYENYIIFAVADCTGHGIPGAFISMLGYSLLNQIIRYHKVKTPGEALELLREQTKNVFTNFHGGMDIALCAIDINTNILQYSGAYNPLYIVRNKELMEFKATKNPIGYYPIEKEFETKDITLEDNDVIYLFSDGYADQFGEDEKGKKSKYTKKRFKNILLNISTRKMQEQKQLLQNNFDLWRDGQEQIDDVTVVGLKWNSDNL